MFETQTNDNAKTPPETKPQQDIADDGKEAPRPNPLWQSLALRPAALQPKPAIRQSDDPHERDAGQVAERVTRLATSPLSYKQLSFKSAPPTAQRKCASCTDEEGIKLQGEEANVSLSSRIQMKSLEVSDPSDADEREADDVARKVADGYSTDVQQAVGTVNRKGSGAGETTPEFQSQLERNKGAGHSLDDSTRSQMESRMATDFNGVRVHTGDDAHEMSVKINARAFTYGKDMYFKHGEYDPGSKSGQELLAHELTHTVQQNWGGAKREVQRKETDEKTALPIPYTVVRDGDKITVTITSGEGKNKVEKSKTVSVKASRTYLTTNYNWNAIVRIMKYLDSEFNDPDNFTYTYPTSIKGELADNKIIIPDDALRFLVMRQARAATEGKKITAANVKGILNGIDGIAGEGFAKTMGLSGVNALRDESTNTTKKDAGGKDIPALDFSQDEGTLYDTLRSLVIARNGLWSDVAKVINMVAVRRRFGKSETNTKNPQAEYNDTIAVCWKQPDAPGGELVKHTRYFMATTMSGDMDSYRNIVPSTVTVLPGTHASKAPVFRTEKVFTDLGGTKKFDETSGSGINIHMGSNEYSGWKSHNMSASIPAAYQSVNPDQDDKFQGWLIIARSTGLIHKWQLRDDVPGYNTLVELDKGKVVFDSNDGTNIKVKKNKEEGTINIAAAREGTANHWLNKKNRAQLASILKQVDNTFEQPTDFGTMKLAAVKALITNERVEAIVREQIKYAVRLSDVDGKAAESFVAMMAGKRTEITDPLVADAKADKKDFDDMMTASQTYPAFTDKLRAYLKGIKGTLSAEKEYMKNKGSLTKAADQMPTSAIDVGAWSVACQVILGNGQYYEFQMQAIKYVKDTGQRRWYYTLIDEASISVPETRQGEVKESAGAGKK